MELHQLRYFLAVVDEGTFTAAADALHISQSGVSTQLQKLERELGLQLVDRSTRRVALTAAGERLVPLARDAVAAVADVARAAEDIRGLVTGSVRVGVVAGLGWAPLFEALGAIHAAHPQVDLRLYEGPSDELVAQVADGRADVAVAAWSGGPPAGVRTAVVVEDPLVVVVGPAHPWSARRGVAADELGSVDLVTLPPGTGARSALDAVTGGRPPRWEVSSPSHVQMLVSRGVGAGVVSATTARSWTGVRVLPISGTAARSCLGVVWRPGPAPAARALLAHLGVEA